MARTFPILSLVLISFISRAQEKIPLDHSVYDGWRDITFRALTPDGRHAIYLFTPQEGDATLVFRDLKSGRRDSVTRAADQIGRAHV